MKKIITKIMLKYESYLWAIIVTLVIVVAIMLYVLTLSPSESLPTVISVLLQPFILCLATIAGAIGFLIASERQKTFSDQVQAHVDQSFNERLGRGVELLAKDDAPIRNAGIRVLVDLANNASDAQKPIAANIIYDFFCDKTSIRIDDKEEYIDTIQNENHQDVQNALDFLAGLSPDEQEKLFPNRLVDGRLNFRNMTFAHLYFTGSVLKNIDFSSSNFYMSAFRNDEIINVSFYDAKFRTSFFGMDHNDYNAQKNLDASNLPQKNIIYDCDFTFARIENSTVFCNTSIESTKFSDIECDASDFLNVEFLRGMFDCRHDISILSGNDLPCFVGTKFVGANFTFGNGYEAGDFIKSCYYIMGEGELTEGMPIHVIRRAEIIDGTLVFTKSGQPAEEQIAVEVAEWKLAQAGKSGKETAKLEKELAQAKRKLQRAQERLKKQQKKKPKKP